METVELWPFSQGELDGQPDGFIDAVFTLGPDLRHESTVTRADYASRIVRGGLPEAAARADPRRRESFLDAYVQALIDRDVQQLQVWDRASGKLTTAKIPMGQYIAEFSELASMAARIAPGGFNSW